MQRKRIKIRSFHREHVWCQTHYTVDVAKRPPRTLQSLYQQRWRGGLPVAYQSRNRANDATIVILLQYDVLSRIEVLLLMTYSCFLFVDAEDRSSTLMIDGQLAIICFLDLIAAVITAIKRADKLDHRWHTYTQCMCARHIIQSKRDFASSSILQVSPSQP